MPWLALIPLAASLAQKQGENEDKALKALRDNSQMDLRLKLEEAQSKAHRYGSTANYDFVFDREPESKSNAFASVGPALQAMEADKKNHPDKNTGTQDSIVKSEWFDHAKGLAEKGDDPEGYDLLDPYKYE